MDDKQAWAAYKEAVSAALEKVEFQRRRQIADGNRFDAADLKDAAWRAAGLFLQDVKAAQTRHIPQASTRSLALEIAALIQIAAKHWTLSLDQMEALWAIHAPEQCTLRPNFDLLPRKLGRWIHTVPLFFEWRQRLGERAGPLDVPLLPFGKPMKPELSSPAEMSVQPTKLPTDNRARVESFLQRARSIDQKRRYGKQDIWKSAGYTDRTEFEHWQRHDPDTTKAAQRNFDRIMQAGPEKFVAALNCRKLKQA